MSLIPWSSPQRQYRLPHRVVPSLGARVGAMIGAMVYATVSVGAQTLFARPDTTPNYASYQYLEDCMIAVFRTTEATEGRGQTIWWDTIGWAREKELKAELGIRSVGVNNRSFLKARPDAVIEAGRVCLARFNADTATFRSTGYALRIFDALLLAQRDADADRFVQRALDSTRVKSATEYKNMLQWILQMYTTARPLRYAEAKKFHARILSTVEGDSLYRAIDADRWLLDAALTMGDTAYSDELAWHAIRINDAMAVEERRGSPGAIDRLPWLVGKLVGYGQDEALDSLTVSNVAYNMWYENVVKRRVMGGELLSATDAQVQPYKIPDLVGEHYYTAAETSSGPSSQGQVSYTSHGPVPPGTLPVKGRITFLTSLPSFCHTEGLIRPPESLLKGSNWSCGGRLRRLKEMYPDLDIIVLTNTYGTVGQLGPITPAEEADTLAKLFLGHHHVPGRLVVENTEFFLVEAPDGRRIDLPTPQMELLGPPRVVYDRGLPPLAWWVDKDGYKIKMMGSPDGGAGSKDSFDRFYTVLKNRPSKGETR